MNETILKKEKRDRRHKRIRAKVKGTAERPRLAVFKSNKALYAQLIDDRAGGTLLSVQTGNEKKPFAERAHDAGTKLATEAKKKGIEVVVFDRGGFAYMGVVKAFADGAREGGMTF